MGPDLFEGPPIRIGVLTAGIVRAVPPGRHGDAQHAAGGRRIGLHGLHVLGRLIEFDVTHTIFVKPKRKETEDHVTGRFGQSLVVWRSTLVLPLGGKVKGRSAGRSHCTNTTRRFVD